jgi:hypothetical protein
MTPATSDAEMPLWRTVDHARRRCSVLPFGRVRGLGTGADCDANSRRGSVVFTTRRAVRSGAGLQLADRQVSGEHRFPCIRRQPCVGLSGGLRAIAGLLQLHHGVVIR